MKTPVELFIDDVEWLANSDPDVNDTLQVGPARMCEDGRYIDRLEAAVVGLIGTPVEGVALGFYDQDDEGCEGA